MGQNIIAIAERIFFDENQTIILPILKELEKQFKEKSENMINRKKPFPFPLFSKQNDRAERIYNFIHQVAITAYTQVVDEYKKAGKIFKADDIAFKGQIAYDLSPKYKQLITPIINNLFNYLNNVFTIDEIDENVSSQNTAEAICRMLENVESCNFQKKTYATKQQLFFVKESPRKVKSEYMTTSCLIAINNPQDFKKQLNDRIDKHIDSYSEQKQDIMDNKTEQAENKINQFIDRLDTILINHIKSSVTNDIIEKILYLGQRFVANDNSRRKSQLKKDYADFQELFKMAQDWEDLLYKRVRDNGQLYPPLHKQFLYEYHKKTWRESFPFYPEWGDFIGKDKNKENGSTNIVVPFSLKMGSYGVSAGKNKKINNLCNLQNRWEEHFRKADPSQENYTKIFIHMLFSLGAYSPTIQALFNSHDRKDIALDNIKQDPQLLDMIEQDINKISNKIVQIKSFVFDCYKEIPFAFFNNHESLNYTKYLSVSDYILNDKIDDPDLFKPAFGQNHNSLNFLQLTQDSIFIQNQKRNVDTDLVSDFPIKIFLQGAILKTQLSAQKAEKVTVTKNTSGILSLPTFFQPVAKLNQRKTSAITFEQKFNNEFKKDSRPNPQYITSGKEFFFKITYLIFLTLMYKAIEKQTLNKGLKPFFNFFQISFCKNHGDNFFYNTSKIFESLFTQNPDTFAGSQTYNLESWEKNTNPYKIKNTLSSLYNNFPIKISPSTGLTKNWGLITITSKKQVERQQKGQALKSLLYGDSYVFILDPHNKNEYLSQQFMSFAEPSDTNVFYCNKVANIMKKMKEKGIKNIILLAKMLITQASIQKNQGDLYFLNPEHLKKYEKQGVDVFPLFMSEYKIADIMKKTTSNNCLYIDDTSTLSKYQNRDLGSIQPLFTLVNSFVVSSKTPSADENNFHFKTAVAYNSIQFYKQASNALLYNISKTDKPELLKIIADYHITQNEASIGKAGLKIQPHKILNKKRSFIQKRMLNGISSGQIAHEYNKQSINAFCLMQELIGLLAN